MLWTHSDDIYFPHSDLIIHIPTYLCRKKYAGKNNHSASLLQHLHPKSLYVLSKQQISLVSPGGHGSRCSRMKFLAAAGLLKTCVKTPALLKCPLARVEKCNVSCCCKTWLTLTAKFSSKASTLIFNAIQFSGSTVCKSVITY